MTSQNASPEPPAGTWDPAFYDRRHAFVWRAASDLLDLLDPKPGERILDLGCGTGHLTRALADRSARVVGLDASPEMIAAARDAYSDIEFVVAPGEDFAFEKPFDAVFSNAALHWMRRAPERVVENVARTLRPGGRFVAEFGGRGNVAHLTAALLEAIRTEIPGSQPAHPWYFPSIAEYAGLLERHGLEVTLAVLFDRPTPLEAEDGFRAWVRMFGASLMDGVPEASRAAVLDRAEVLARPALYRDGIWTVDYRRLRIVAAKTA